MLDPEIKICLQVSNLKENLIETGTLFKGMEVALCLKYLSKLKLNELNQTVIVKVVCSTI